MNGWVARAASTVFVLNGAAYLGRRDAENLRRTRISGSTTEWLRGNGARADTVYVPTRWLNGETWKARGKVHWWSKLRKKLGKAVVPDIRDLTWSLEVPHSCPPQGYEDNVGMVSILRYAGQAYAHGYHRMRREIHLGAIVDQTRGRRGVKAEKARGM